MTKQSKLPPRTLDTMSEAIALSSPSGRTSKRTREAAHKRLEEALFGKGGLERPSCPQPPKWERLRTEAKMLRDLAERGMCVRAYPKRAAQLEQEADWLEELNRTDNP